MAQPSTEPKPLEKNLADIVGAPYIFTLKDGTKLELGEWTLDSELWAKKHFGSMERLFKTLMRIECEDEDTIDAAIRVAIYKLTPHSKSIVRGLIAHHNDTVEEYEPPESETDPFAEEESEETAQIDHISNVKQFFSRYITFAQLSGLVRAEYMMIQDSIPVEALDEVKKNHQVILNQMHSKKAGQKKKKTTRKKTRSR